MKKTILSIFALCATIAATAQTVTIDQAAASYYNAVSITQEGASEMTINQLGNGGSFAIEQTASTRYSAIDIDQSGFYNSTVINQEGANNTINITQAGNGAEDFEINTININQDAFTSNNAVTVSQSGQYHDADIDQLSVTNSTITLSQYVYDNNAILKQDGGDNNDIVAVQTGGADVNLLNILQDGGSGGLVRVNQNGAGGNNSFIIVQEGSDNIISGGGSNYALQQGSGNSATLTQSGSTNQIIFSQVGSGTSVTLTQSGSNNISTINVVL